MPVSCAGKNLLPIAHSLPFTSVTYEHLKVSIKQIKYLSDIPVIKWLLWNGHASLGPVIRIMHAFLLITYKETC